jgi:4-carboxymuconolactone decarboxylase
MSSSEDPRADDRYRRGLNILHRRNGGTVDAATSKLAEIAPDFARMTVEFQFGDLFARPALDARTREIAAIAALATLGHAVPQLRAHVAAALGAGCRREEIVEVLMQISAHAGMPVAANALVACHDLLVEGGDCVRCQPGDGQV